MEIFFSNNAIFTVPSQIGSVLSRYYTKFHETRYARWWIGVFDVG